MTLRIKQICGADLQNLYFFRNSAIQVTGEYITEFVLHDKELCYVKHLELAEQVTRVYRHGEQLLIELSSDIFVCSTDSCTLDSLGFQLDAKTVDALVISAILVVQTRKYVKIFDIATHQLLKAIAFGGNGLLEAGGVFYSFCGDELLIADDSRSQLLDLHKIITIPRESLTITQIGYLNGLYVLTESNILFSFGSGQKLRAMKQLIIGVDAFLLDERYVILYNSEQVFFLTRGTLQVVAIEECTVERVELHAEDRIILIGDSVNEVVLDDLYANGREPVRLKRLTFDRSAETPGMSHQSVKMFFEPQQTEEISGKTFTFCELQDGDFCYRGLVLQAINRADYQIMMLLRSVVVNIVHFRPQKQETPLAVFLLNRQYQIVVVLTTARVVVISLLDAEQKAEEALPFVFTKEPVFYFDENNFALSCDDGCVSFGYDLPEIVRTIYANIQRDFQAVQDLGAVEPQLFASSSSEFE